MMLQSEIIERKALEIRQRLGIGGVCAPEMTYVLDKLSNQISAFSYRPALNAEMGQDEAWMDDDSQTLTVKESVLEDAKAGRSRARFTLAHELGHYFLGHDGIRRRNADKGVYAGPRERAQEREADIFASFFLVPSKLAWDEASAADIAARFQVSATVAEIAFERVQKERRKLSGEKRPLPNSVIDFLKEAKRRGHPVRVDLPED